MFRKNYLPKLKIKKSSKTGKLFAYVPGDTHSRKNFCEYKGSYDLEYLSSATEFDTVDELISAIYSYALSLHLEDIHNNLTYNSVDIRL